jgi:hypothetical protein
MQQILQIDPPSHSADCCLFLVSLGSATTNNSFDIVRMFLCGLLLCLGAGSGHRIQSNIVVCLSPSLPQQLSVASPGRPTPSRSPIELIRKGVGPIMSFVPLPSRSCAKEQLEPAIAPSLCCRGGYFSGYEVKLTASSATEARGGISDGVGWLSWPSSDDLEAIGHGFGGRSTDR